VGPTDRDPQPDMGAVITRQHRDRVLQLIEAGVKEGAKIPADGRGVKVSGAPNGFFVGATILDQVQPGMTVILDGGSTTYTVARLLVDKHLQVITNSLPIASLFSEIGSVETIVTGGSIYSRLGVLIGPLCEQSFEQTHADLAILGGAGITEAGVWNHNALIVAAQRKMIGAAERTIFALDQSKFGRKALSLTAPFDPRFTIVTDTRPAPAVARAIQTAGAKLTLATKKSAARS